MKTYLTMTLTPPSVSVIQFSDDVSEKGVPLTQPKLVSFEAIRILGNLADEAKLPFEGAAGAVGIVTGLCHFEIPETEVGAWIDRVNAVPVFPAPAEDSDIESDIIKAGNSPTELPDDDEVLDNLDDLDRDDDDDFGDERDPTGQDDDDDRS